MKLNQIALAIVVSLVLSPEHTFSQGGLNQRIDELSQQIATEMAEYQKTTIAVVEFTDLQGNVTDLGRFIAEELITRLFQTKQFKVIERQLLNKVLSEQDLSLTGIIDPTSAKELEKILGVDAIASGTITDLAQSLRVNARLISTETGEIFAVASTEIFKDESVMRLMAAVAAPAVGSAIQPKVESRLPTTNASAKYETNGFIFALTEVRKSQSNLTIEIIAENISEKDRTLRLYPKTTRCFDEEGNEYHPSATGTRIANRTYQRGFGFVESLLISGVPVRIVLPFENVSGHMTKIALLVLDLYTGTDQLRFKAQFRDIPIPQ